MKLFNRTEVKSPRAYAKENSDRQFEVCRLSKGT